MTSASPRQRLLSGQFVVPSLIVNYGPVVGSSRYLDTNNGFLHRLARTGRR